MVFRFLKWARVGVSLIVLLLIGFIFIDFGNNLSPGVTGGILFFQFVPSILKFINLLTLASAGFILVIISTLLFGRVYCSFLCPLGAMQDILGFLSARLKSKRKKFRYAGQKQFLRYIILASVILIIATGSTLFLNLLDPYSLFGKINSNMLRPVYYGINNVLAYALAQLGNFTLFKVVLKNFSWASFGISLAFTGLIVWLVYHHGRLYCNTVCPVGTFLGILSRFSKFRISLDESLCSSCGICGANCKSECIDTKNKTVDFSRCVGCMNCLISCESGGVKFSIKKRSSDPEPAIIENGQARRHFLRNTALISTGLLAVTKDAFTEGINDGKKPVVKEYTVTPPGSVSLKHFNNTCTACHLCVSACPTHVLQPSLLHYGLSGFLQPFMDYHTDFCNYECTVCGDICPTGAIFPLALEDKKLTQMGVSKFIKENCVVYTDEKDCGACSEHCPTKAVNMVFYKDDLKIPEVDDKICVGCGACEYACPTTPKSIYVEGNPIHKIAQKPKVQKIETKVNPEDDFPF